MHNLKYILNIHKSVAQNYKELEALRSSNSSEPFPLALLDDYSRQDNDSDASVTDHHRLPFCPLVSPLLGQWILSVIRQPSSDLLFIFFLNLKSLPNSKHSSRPVERVENGSAHVDH